MNYSVVIHTNAKNQHDVCVVDEDMLPACFFLSNHIVYSFSDLAFNTRLTYAKTLLFVFCYFTAKSIDLPERVRSGKFFTREEYEDFKRYCKYKKEDEIESKNVISFEKLSAKKLDNLIYATQSTEGKVASTTVKMRLRQFKDYISYLYQTFHFANNVPVSVCQNHDDFVRQLDIDIRSTKDNNASVKDPFEQSIPDAVFFKILEISKPFSPENPWTKNTRNRNKLILSVLIDTGIRQGALAKLKKSDLKEDTHGARLLITRTPDDPTDPRKHKPAQKTKAHSSAISVETKDALKRYINTERNGYHKANTHDFIFVGTKGDHEGLPITNSAIAKIFKTLSDAVEFPLHPHLFRHKWNEIFHQKALKAGFTHSQMVDIAKYAMGWTESSTMISRYNEFCFAVTVHELSAQRQSETVPSQKEASNENNK